MPLVGSPAPEFKANAYVNGELKELSLSDYRGKWVYLLFYPLDFTFVCPTEILAFSRRAQELRDLGCEVIGVSIDSHFVHKAWVETPRDKGGLGGIDMPLVADMDKQIAASYGVLAGAIALRGLFLIDPEGVVQQAAIHNLPVGRSTNEAKRVLTAFQFVKNNDGLVCPADWEAGQDTMKADSDSMAKFLSEKID